MKNTLLTFYRKLVISLFMIIFSSGFSLVHAACSDKGKNDGYLSQFNLSDQYDMTQTILSTCPVKNARVRTPDQFAREGGKFYANRGRNNCHFALDLEVFHSVQTNHGKGEPVVAAGTGKVRLASNNWGAAGKTVIIDHGNNFYTLYAHLNKIQVKTNTQVKAGQQIGEVGFTGNAKGMEAAELAPHLHFTFMRTTKPLSNWKPLSVIKEIEKVNDTIPYMGGFGFINPISICN